MFACTDVRYELERVRPARQHDGSSVRRYSGQSAVDDSEGHGEGKAEGDKVSFVNDKDGKSWDVMNPEELKDHDGHHVQLSAHVYADKNAIHVMSVKMLKGAKTDTMTK